MTWGLDDQDVVDEPDGEAPGWEAIAQAVREAGVEEPMHYATGALPEQDGAYAINAHPIPHGWLLMTLGLTDLFAKTSDDPDVSGWGFELTMRIPREPGDEEPAPWALRLLLRLSRHVDAERQPFAPGHRLDLGAPLTGEAGTRLTAVAFAPDPLLATVHTVHGALDLLAVVGITADELAEMRRASTEDVLEPLRRADPLLVTDPRR